MAELRAVYLFSDGDPATIPSRHRIPINTSNNREDARLLGGRVSWDVGGGDPAHVRAIPRHCPHRGVQVAQS